MEDHGGGGVHGDPRWLMDYMPLPLISPNQGFGDIVFLRLPMLAASRRGCVFYNSGTKYEMI